MLFKRDVAKEIARNGVVLARGMINPDVALAVDRRIRLNLERTQALHPDYMTNADKSVFPVSVAMAEPSEPTLPARLEQARKSNILDPHFVRPEEAAALAELVEPVLRALSPLGSFDMAGLDNCYARFERARPNSAYGGYFIHQDSVFQLHGYTTWIALCRCGDNAPALQFIPQKRTELLPTAADGAKHINPGFFRERHWVRPRYEPGDVVIFESYTVHGTYVTRTMTESRTSLDVRFKARH